MSDPLQRTVRIWRPAKVSTDDRGRSVWSEPVEETELELVSTTMLRKLLDSNDVDKKRELDELAASKEGLLAKNLASGSFEIVDDEDLKAALASADAVDTTTGHTDVDLQPLLERVDNADEELSLVSTQALRKILGHADDKPAKAEPLAGGGFDPYNNS
ncbi:MAG TPA: hypothetical protein PKK10_13195 [Woeseiaceae bacterium]|nr:hypothetical protein [Woeseiaceae bacterium]